MQQAKDLLKQKINEYVDKSQNKKVPYVSQEFQDYGLRLAHSFDDLKNKALYIGLSKSTPRALLEDAAAYVYSYPKARNKARLFMWRLKTLADEYKQKHPDFKLTSISRSKRKSKSTKNTKDTKSTKSTGKKITKKDLPTDRRNQTPGEVPSKLKKTDPRKRKSLVSAGNIGFDF